VVELWKGSIALIMTERVYTSMYVCIEAPIPLPVGEVTSTSLGLSPNGPQLRGNYKGRYVKSEM